MVLFEAKQAIKWWRWRNLTAKFSLKDFYAQTIEKFVVAIPDMIESQKIAKKVSGNQKTSKSNVEDLPCQKFVI